MKFTSMERISLKNHSEVNEDMIQQYIFDNTGVLGLGDLTALRREKVQPAGGRLDMLLMDDDNTRYEVEIQLGATDPSHIIRTIEYWDSEKKRYPQFDHCAVIVAEEITGRFMNVISLFNGAIPLVALQMSAYKNGEDISLVFTKVIDRVSLATDEEEANEVTDRAYWEKKSTPKILKQVDVVFDAIKEYATGYELKYNKFYIGTSNNGITKNFVSFKPKKNFFYLCIKGPKDDSVDAALDNAGAESSYISRENQYRIRLNSHTDYTKNKDLLDSMIRNAMQYLNVLD